MKDSRKKVFIVRNENGEEDRTPLVPEDVKRLIKAGHKVFVISSENRSFKDEEYEAADAKIIHNIDELKLVLETEGKNNCIIVGVKETPQDIHDIEGITQMCLALMYRDQFPIGHKGLVHKNQRPARENLLHHVKKNQKMIDIEFLYDSENKRLVASGFAAGYNTAALAILTWCKRELGEDVHESVKKCTREELTNLVRTKLIELKNKFPQKTPPSFAIMGPNGRSGQGAQLLLDNLGDLVGNRTLLTRQETEGEIVDGKRQWKNGLVEKIKESDVFLNCIHFGLEVKLPLLLTESNMRDSHLVIGDCTCRLGINNPILQMGNTSTFDDPVIQLGQVQVMNINRTPSLTPKDSSEEFSHQLCEVYIDIENNAEYFLASRKVLELFKEHTEIPSLAYKLGQEFGKNGICSPMFMENKLRDFFSRNEYKMKPYEIKNCVEYYIPEGFLNAKESKKDTILNKIFRENLITAAAKIKLKDYDKKQVMTH